MLYMYTQRHLMQYGAPYNTELVRGQYESGAHNSSKATLAGKAAFRHWSEKLFKNLRLILKISYLSLQSETCVKFDIDGSCY